MKLNSLKMACSLFKDKEGMDLFAKVNGLDLIIKMIENGAELNKQFKTNHEKELFKIREPMDISGKKLK